MADHWWRSPFIAAGATVWLLCLVGWGIAWVLDPGVAARMGATFGAFLVGGKFAGIPTGLAFGLHPLLVGLVVTVPDAGAVLVTYPLLDTGLDVAGRWSFVLRDAAKRAHTARTQRSFITRLGGFGVFLLTMSPFGLVSPIVVAAIGRALGLPAAQVIPPVFAGIAVFAALIVLGVDAGLNLAAQLHPAMPFILTGTFVGLMLAREGWLRWKAKRGAAKDADARQP